MSGSDSAPTRRVVVAVDGPAGSGKSSVSKAVARRLGYDFLDTGAAYRALAWWALECGISLDDADAVRGLLPDFDYALTLSPDHLVFRVAGTDVTAAIREPRVSAAVSSIARVPEVRAHLTAMFRDLMLGGSAPGVITEGRDITTVVAPDATVRVLLTASEEARQGRRAAELTGENADDVGRRLRERDAQDLTVVDFMTAADGVTTLDSTKLTFDETVDALAELIHRVAATR